MDYIKSKYAFAVARKLPNNREICLLFSGRTGKNMFVSPSTYRNVTKGDFHLLNVEVQESLVKQKILVPENEDELFEVNKENELAMKQDSNDRLYISIQPTASCQLACDYCGQKHSHKALTEDTMNAIIKRVTEKLSQSAFKILEIGWFGGEPLCALGNMRTLNEQLKRIAADHDVKYRGHITTNGYALTPKLYEELKEEFNIKRIEITIDGSKEYHDARRITCSGKGSFDRIFNNLESIVLSEYYDMDKCIISVRCNVDERNVEGVFPLLKTFVQKNMQHKILFYTTAVVSWSNNGAGSEEGCKSLGKKSTDHIAYMLENGFKIGILPHRTAPFKCLGTDANAEMYDADGNIFNCSETSYSDYYSEQGYVLGNVMHERTGNSGKRSKLSLVPNMLLNKGTKPCDECKFYPLCGGLCPLALLEGTPRCPSFTYNIEDRIFLDFLAKNRTKH